MCIDKDRGRTEWRTTKTCCKVQCRSSLRVMRALPTAKQPISSKDNIPHCRSLFLIQRSTFNERSFAIRHRPLCSDGIGCIIPAFNAIYSIEAAHFILLRVCSCRIRRFRHLTDMPFYITLLSAAITI